MEQRKAIMEESNQNLFPESNRGEWIRLRTMIFIRWVAISGQIAAIIIAYKYFGLVLNLSPVSYTHLTLPTTAYV